MNQCILTGNLGADPDIRYSQNGDAIATFNLAFRLSKDKTGWVKVTCFNKTAELAETYLHKGAKVLLSGNLDYNQWENQEGQQRTSIQLIANRIEFIKTDGRGFEGGQHDNGDPPF
ncbi:MAG: single-stranded DNA-binding protein [Syntrophobacteraceae bacterium]|jgi:single-strand DNA-binding protein